MESKKEKRNVKIKRIYKCDKQVLGIMTLFDDLSFPFFEVRTLELPDEKNQIRISCIPCGEYEVIKRWSEKYGDHFHILEVPDRDYILIHSANYYTQLLGCVAVGFSHTDIDGDGYRDVTNSRKALEKLNEHLPKRFDLTIYEDLA